MKLGGYISYTTVDGLEILRSPVEVGCLYHYLQVFIPILSVVVCRLQNLRQ